MGVVPVECKIEKKAMHYSGFGETGIMQAGVPRRSRGMHPITNMLSRLPMRLSFACALVGFCTYGIFLLLTALTGNLARVFFSFMHLVQLDFSILIAIGLYFLDVYYRILGEGLREIRDVFVVQDDEFERYIGEVNHRMGDARGVLFSTPFVILAIASIFLFVMPTMPNSLFPADPLSPIWLYVSIIEFSLIMLPMFGIAIWIGVVIISVSRDIGRKLEISIEPISPDRAGGLVSFSDVLLKGVFMYSLLLILLVPLLAFLVNSLTVASPFFALIPSIGLEIAILTVCMFFLVPQFFIHRILDDEKKKHLAQVSREVNSVLSNVRGMLSTQSPSDIPDPQLTMVSLQLTTFFDQVEKMKTWPSNLSIIIKAVSSLFLILVTFFINQLLVIYLQSVFG
jgi:hypothetical protein